MAGPLPSPRTVEDFPSPDSSAPLLIARRPLFLVIRRPLFVVIRRLDRRIQQEAERVPSTGEWSRLPDGFAG